MNTGKAILTATLLLFATVPARAQQGFFGGADGGAATELVARFDADGDGVLNDTERKAARGFAQSSGGRRVSVPSRIVAPTLPELGEDLKASAAAAPKENAGLYDEGVLRTLYLRFPAKDWYDELNDFYGTDVDVPADLVVDGRLYTGVGVRFRGNSSYRMTSSSLKKSFNVSVDFHDPGLRLLGYRTLNLLNAAGDPSFLREVLYSRIARSYIPAARTNLVKVVVNGESWGVYVNAQQFNSDLVREWFDTAGGARWKVPAGGFGRSGGTGFTWLGADPESYRRVYELKSADRPEAWRDLMRLCQVLAETPDSRLEAELAAILDVDGALWFLALENVFIDGDGYLSRGSDFSLYQDPRGRFHLLPYDSNETFRFAQGGGPNSWGASGPQLSPVAHEDTAARPLVRRLLSLPSTRARYLAHVRTIMQEWLDWSVIGPVAARYHALIDAAVGADDKKLFPYEAFRASVSEEANAGGDPAAAGGFGGGFGGAPSLERFVRERKAFLEANEALRQKGVTVASVSKAVDPLSTETVTVTAGISGSAGAVLLHWAADALAPFTAVAMSRGLDGRWAARIPAQPSGSRVRYYVEARSAGSAFASTFGPESAERQSHSYVVRAAAAASTNVVINEIAAAAAGAADWIELYNTGSRSVDISGMYLSDDPARPRRWTFPAGTLIPARGYLLIRADGGSSTGDGLHAAFRLSAGGETIVLSDTDARANLILDSVTFPALDSGASLGRNPDGGGGFRLLQSTPGAPNRP